MKIIKSYKIIPTVMALMLSCGYATAQCDHADDFTTLTTSSKWSNTESSTTAAQWVCENFCVVEGGGDGSSPTNLTNYKALEIGEKGVGLNGFASKAGSITSPVLSGGCNSLSFNYASRNSDANRKVQIDIVQDGETVWSTTFQETTTVSATKYTYSTEVTGVTGAYQLKMKNIMAKSGTPGFGNDITIWNICMTSPVAEVAAPTFTVSGHEKSENLYWDTAAVSLATSTPDAVLYYTTDGADPTAESTLYEAPFTLAATATVKALAVYGDLQSAIVDTLVTIAGPQTAALPYEEAFSSSLGDWYTYSTTGDQVWGNGEESGQTFAKMSGAENGGSSIFANEDWLISPAFTVDEGYSLAFSFTSARQFDGDPLVLKYSADYAGVGNPSSATWTDITGVAQWSPGENARTPSGEVVIDTLLPVRFAFVYTSDANDAADWLVGAIHADNKDAAAPSAPSDLTAEATETSITLSWTASEDNVDVAGYTLYLAGDSIDTVTGTEYTFSGLTVATEYTLEVEAFDAAGNRSEKASIAQETLNPTGIPNAGGNKTAVYPNPFTDYIVIRSAGNGNVTLYDLAGKAVLKATVTPDNNRIDVRTLPKGVYLLKQGSLIVKTTK